MGQFKDRSDDPGLVLWRYRGFILFGSSEMLRISEVRRADVVDRKRHVCGIQVEVGSRAMNGRVGR